MSVSVSVCPQAHFGTTHLIFIMFLCVLPMAVARSSSGGVAICYVLPVSIITRARGTKVLNPFLQTFGKVKDSHYLNDLFI